MCGSVCMCTYMPECVHACACVTVTVCLVCTCVHLSRCLLCVNMVMTRHEHLLEERGSSGKGNWARCLTHIL